MNRIVTVSLLLLSLAAVLLHCSGMRLRSSVPERLRGPVTRVREALSRVRTPRSIDWLVVIAYTDNIINTVDAIKNNFQLDFSAGAAAISSSEETLILRNLTLPLIAVNESYPKVLVAHQLGKKVVRQLPDAALLGVLVLIASELLQRGVSQNKFSSLPPVLLEIANTTVLELDAKLEYLSSVRWDVDPFIQSELEILQTQPLEFIDKYIVKEFLPKIDKELSPVLSKLITDPQQVKQVTKSIKDLIKVGSNFLLAEQVPTTTIERKTFSFMEQVSEQVDKVGETVEEAITDWNSLISEFNNFFKIDSVVKLSSGIFKKQSTAPPNTTENNATADDNGRHTY